jgi:hypothetical protein
MFDSSLALLRERYLFILRRCKRARTDAFTARLMLKKTVCMGGSNAARIFYDPQHFQRGDLYDTAAALSSSFSFIRAGPCGNIRPAWRIACGE